MIRPWIIDVAIGVALGLAVAALVMMSSFNSTFIYRGF